MNLPSLPVNAPTEDVSLQSGVQISSARMSPARGELLSMVVKYLSIRAWAEGDTPDSGHSVLSVT